jgi:hypothetical protein
VTSQIHNNVVNCIVEVTRTGSDYVPYEVSIGERSECELMHYSIGDYESHFATDVWSLPEKCKGLDVEEKLIFKGDLCIEFHEYWTDCGTEYDSDGWFENVEFVNEFD